MALIETSHYNITENSNNSKERQDQQKQESLDFIPVVHVKDVYKSFDYTYNRNNNSGGITATYDRLIREQHQLNSRSSLRASSYEVLNGVNLKIKEGEFVTIIAGFDKPNSVIFLIKEVMAINNPFQKKRK